MKRILSVLVVMLCIVCACFTTAFKSGEDQSKSGCLNLTLRAKEDGKTIASIILQSSCSYSLWYITDDGDTEYRNGTYSIIEENVFEEGELLDYRRIIVLSLYDENGSYLDNVALNYRTDNTVHLFIDGLDFTK